MARRPRAIIDIVHDHDRHLEAIRAAELRQMHDQASRQATQVAGTLTAGARRNAFGGIFPFMVAQAQRQRRGRR
jgi:hypothetical protein